MIGIAGIALVVVMVFGGYTLAGGKLGIVLEAMPHELMTIFGAAIGASDQLSCDFECDIEVSSTGDPSPASAKCTLEIRP